MTWFWLDIDWLPTLKLWCITQYWRWNFVLFFLVVCQNHGCKKAVLPKNYWIWARAIYEGLVASISKRHWTSWEWWHDSGWTLISQPHWILIAWFSIGDWILFWSSGHMSKSLLQKSRADQKFITLSNGNPWGTSCFYIFKALNNLGVIIWFWLDIDWPSMLNLGCMNQQSRWKCVWLVRVVCQNHGCKKAGHWTTWKLWHGFGLTFFGKPHWILVA